MLEKAVNEQVNTLKNYHSRGNDRGERIKLFITTQGKEHWGKKLEHVQVLFL